MAAQPPPPPQHQHHRQPGVVCRVWGLIGDQLHCGTPLTLDSYQASRSLATIQAAAVLSSGWNPPLDQPAGDTGTATALQRLLSTLPHEAKRNTEQPVVRQLSVGWGHAVMLLSDGQAYVCDTAELWQHDNRQETDAAAQASQQAVSPSPWQLLQLHNSPASAPCSSSLPPQHQVVQVAAGDAHCLLLTAAGGVWALGSNRYGQVGASVSEQQPTQLQQAGAEQFPCSTQAQQQPQQPKQHNAQPSSAAAVLQHPVLVLGPGAPGGVCQEAVAQIAAGSCHSAAVTSTTGRRNLYCWGWNAHGQCCVGTTTSVQQPALCSALDGVPLAAVAAGMAHTVCVSVDGAVYACGWNSNGQLGTAAATTQYPEQQAVEQGGASAPAAAAATTGASQQEQHCGVGETAAGSSSCQQQQQQKQLLCVSSLQPVLVESSELDQEHVVQVASGSRHTLVLTAAGSVFAWGWNKYLQCGLVGGVSDVLQPTRVHLADRNSQQPQAVAVAVHAGRWHTLIHVTES